MERLFGHIAYGRDESFFLKILLFPLYLLSLVYKVAVNIRLFSFSTGLLKARKLDCKVISVGNITVGGTGKTPTVELLATRLKEKGLKAAILSRGYGRKGKGIGIVSDGKEIFLGPEEAGDEPYMLARRLKNIPVLVGPDRYELGRYAMERFPLDVIILDDGFQHIRLKRDLDILLVDGEKGFGNGCLLPRGPLREPLTGIRRAGIVLINKISSDSTRLEDKIAELSAAVIFRSSYKVKRLVSVPENEGKEMSSISGSKVLAVSAIASPLSFVNLLSSLGCIIVKDLSYPDHHSYTRRDMEFIKEQAFECGADVIITTEKDSVKMSEFELKKNIPFCYLNIEVDIGGGKQRFMDSVLSGISS